MRKYSKKTGKEIKKIYRKCCICGKRLRITLYSDRFYRGGQYWGKFKIPIKGTGEHKKIGEGKFGKHKYEVVKWTGKEREVEMWDCNACSEEEDHEAWLDDILYKLFKERCSKFYDGCKCCNVWKIYDKIIEHNRKSKDKVYK